MAAALDASREDLADQAAAQWALTTRLRETIAAIPGVRVHGHATQRVPHLVCFSVDELDSEVLAMALDDRGFRLAVGSNCSGAASEPSPVLGAMGVSGVPSFRLGIGRETTPDDVETFLAVLPGLVQDLRQVETRTQAAMARHGSGRDPAL
jgi:cysteine desulfurase